MGPQGAQHIAHALTNNTVIHASLLIRFFIIVLLHYLMQTITTLDLTYTVICDEGTQHLSHALTHNTVIHYSPLIFRFIAIIYHIDTHCTLPWPQSNRDPRGKIPCRSSHKQYGDAFFCTHIDLHHN